MDTVLFIFGTLLLVVAFFVALADILEWSKRRRIILAGLSGIVGIAALSLVFWPSDKPATKSEIQEIVQTDRDGQTADISNLHDSTKSYIARRMDKFEQHLLEPRGSKGLDTVYVSVFREQTELLDSIVVRAVENAIADMELGELRRASVHLDYANEYATNDTSRAHVHIFRGMIKLMQGDTVSSLTEFNIATSLNPDNYYTWYNKANVHQQLGDLAEARSAYERALFIQWDPDALYNLGLVSYRERRYTEALSHFESALAIRPNDVDTWKAKGLAMAILGQATEANRSFDLSLQMGQDTCENLNFRGRAHQWSGDYRQAIKSYKASIECQSRTPASWYYMAVSYAELSIFDTALICCDSAERLDPSYIMIDSLRIQIDSAIAASR